MAGVKFTNFASTTIATASVAVGDTSFSVAAATGNLFPTIVAGEWFYLVLTDSLTAPTKREVVKVTTRTVDSMAVVVRAQEGTTAQTWVAGNFCACRPTNQGLIDLINAIINVAVASSTALSSALVSFLQSGVGAIIRSAQDVFRESKSVTDYAANGVSGVAVDPTGTVESYLGFQAAITANYGKKLRIPAGTYKCNGGTINITDAITLVGDGRDETFITWTDTTLDLFSVASAASVHFADIGFSGPASSTAGAIITLAHSAAGVQYFSSFRRCLFSRGYDQIKTVSAAAWTIDNCYFSAWVRRAVTVQSVNTPDAGDSSIHGNCVFANGIAGSVAVYQVSSGGLKITGNKFNGLGAYAYQMQLASGAVTSDLLITGNSFENHTTAALKFDTDGGGASLSQLLITGNQFALSPLMIDMSGATAFLYTVSIVGNTFSLNASGTYGVNMANITRYEIASNTFLGQGGTPVGINLAASCSNGQLGPNNFVSLTTPVSDSSTSKAKVYFTDTRLSADGIQFPATQVVSSNVNCLDDYEENTAATPLALTFATAGDLSVVYTRQVTQYIKIGKQVTVWFNIVTSTFTHTTASGNLQLTGLPFAVDTITDYNLVSSMGWSGLNLQAGYTSVGPQTSSASTILIFYMSGDAVAGGNITTTEATTGATIVLRGSITYIAAA